MKQKIGYFAIGVVCALMLVYGAELAIAQSQEPAHPAGTYAIQNQILENGHVLGTVLDTRSGEIVDAVRFTGLSGFGADDWVRQEVPDYSEFTPGK